MSKCRPSPRQVSPAADTTAQPGSWAARAGSRALKARSGAAGVPVTVTYGNQGAVVMDESGTVIDPMEPSVLTILDLMAGPELRHKGAWPLWAAGVLVCALTAASILFADEWFRLGLAFRIRGADRAEPSDWEIAGRYLSWTALPVLALALFIGGLR